MHLGDEGAVDLQLAAVEREGRGLRLYIHAEARRGEEAVESSLPPTKVSAPSVGKVEVRVVASAAALTRVCRQPAPSTGPRRHRSPSTQVEPVDALSLQSECVR